MTLVDGVVADGLADEMVGDRPALQPVLVEELVAAVQIPGVGERLVDLEVVSPAGEFQTVVTEVTGVPAHLLQGQIGPLAGEQRERAWHSDLLL